MPEPQTLAQWCEVNSVKLNTTEGAAVFAIVDQLEPARRELFHLSDYTVSACCGITIWLVPGPSYSHRKQQRTTTIPGDTLEKHNRN